MYFRLLISCHIDYFTVMQLINYELIFRLYNMNAHFLDIGRSHLIIFNAYLQHNRVSSQYCLVLSYFMIKSR